MAWTKKVMTLKKSATGYGVKLLNRLVQGFMSDQKTYH